MKHPFLWSFKDFFILNHLDMEWMVNFTLQVKMSPFSLWVFFLAGPPCPQRPPTHPLGWYRPVSIITTAQQQVHSVTTQGPHSSQQLRPARGAHCVWAVHFLLYFLKHPRLSVQSWKWEWDYFPTDKGKNTCIESLYFIQYVLQMYWM